MYFGVSAAGGADSYGYVSEAQLWATGQLVVPDRFAALAPLLGPGVAPLGYRLAQTPGAIVPVYSPGLPLAMAVALKAGGPSAVFYVVPLFGGLAVWLTYMLAEPTFGGRPALMASVLLAASPLFSLPRASSHERRAGDRVVARCLGPGHAPRDGGWTEWGRSRDGVGTGSGRGGDGVGTEAGRGRDGGRLRRRSRIGVRQSSRVRTS